MRGHCLRGPTELQSRLGDFVGFVSQCANWSFFQCRIVWVSRIRGSVSPFTEQMWCIGNARSIRLHEVPDLYLERTSAVLTGLSCCSSPFSANAGTVLRLGYDSPLPSTLQLVLLECCTFDARSLAPWRHFTIIRLYRCAYRYASLNDGIRSEKFVVRRFRRCAKAIQCTYTNLDSTA